VKSLSPALLDAQKSRSARPYVKAVLSDYYSEGARVRFQRWYTGSENNSPIACVGAADGALIRARNEAGTLYVSRVAAPDSGSTYSSWTSVGSAFADTDIALVRLANDDLWLLYVDTDQTTLRLRASTDDGATWGSAVTAVAAGGNKDHLAAAANEAGDVVLLWNEGATVYSSRWNGSSWGARTAWTRTVASITGLAVRWMGDFQVVVAGTEDAAGNPKVWATRFGDGFAGASGTWTPLRTITEASAGSGVSFSYPGLEFFGGLWRLFFLETFTGDVAYARVQYATKPTLFDFNIDQWREALPFDYEGNPFGLAACALDAGQLMLVASDGVWAGTLLPSIDVSADVLEATVDCDTEGARARIELDNSAGQYTAYGAGGLAAFQRGARIELSPGYVTSAGNEVNTTRDYAYWVETIEVVSPSRAGPARLVLHCRGADWLLRRWRARRQYVFAGGVEPLSGLLFLIASRAGMPFGTAGNSSAAYDALTPAFTVHPGESGLTALGRVVEKVPDVLYFDAGALFATEPRATDTSQYAFGPETHAIVEGRYRDKGAATNRARVVGAGVYSDAFDFEDIAAFGESIGTVVDANIEDAGDAEDRAASLLRSAVLASRADTITVFGVHCGIQLYDVVDVSDPGAGLSAAPRRVLGYSWRYSTGARPRYDMSLRLGEV
jgi:hypothetical protein